MERVLWILFIVTVVGIGCSPEKEPENESSDSIRIRKPSNIVIGDIDNAGSIAELDKYCFEANTEDSCNLSSIDPQDVIEKKQQESRKSIFIIPVTPGEDLSFHYTPANPLEKDKPPYPDEITITEFNSDEDTGVEVEIFGDDNNEIQAPDEMGKYFYSIHTEWNDEFEGEAYYVFSFVVKEEDS